MWVRAVYTKKGGGGGGGGGVRHKQVCTRVDSEGQKKCFLLCQPVDQTPGSSDSNSDTLATELRPPSGRLWFCFNFPQKSFTGRCLSNSTPIELLLYYWCIPQEYYCCLSGA